MAKHPTGAKRNRKQKVKARYSKAREEAQLSGVIETIPEGAVRDERVNPASQGEQALPALDRRAVREDGVGGWSVPERVKRVVIERLAEPFFEEGRTVVDKEGRQVTLPPDRNLLKENAKVLVLADQRQYERDQPELAGKAKGQTNVQVNTFDCFEFFRRLVEAREQQGTLAIEESGKEVYVDEMPAETGAGTGSLETAAKDPGL